MIRLVWVEEDVDSMEVGSRGFPKDLAKQTILYKARKNDPAGSTFRLFPYDYANLSRIGTLALIWDSVDISDLATSFGAALEAAR